MFGRLNTQKTQSNTVAKGVAKEKYSNLLYKIFNISR